jgi:hypothetical protein
MKKFDVKIIFLVDGSKTTYIGVDFSTMISLIEKYAQSVFEIQIKTL